MFNIFKKKTSTNAFGFLHTDMHSHLLPDIDDGSTSISESLELIDGLYDLGFKKLITTPHIYDAFYKNSKQTIEPAYLKVKQAIAEKFCPVELIYSAEYFVDEAFDEKLLSKDLIPLPNNHVLIEMSFVAYSQSIEHAVFKLVQEGYRPILAHPERYQYLVRNMNIFQKLVNLGCELQLNINSFGGYYGKGVEVLAKELLARKMVSFLGTDLHDLKQLHFLTEMGKSKRLIRLISHYDWKNPSL